MKGMLSSECRMKIYTEAEVLELLAEEIAKTTASAVADQIGVSRQYINDLTKGRRPPSDSVLTFLNLERVIREKDKHNGKAKARK